MAVGDEQRLITPISQRQFELYALSLERGPNFDPALIFGSYQAGHGSASGCILLDPERGTFNTLALRRRVDHRWVPVHKGGPYPAPEAALDHLSISMRAGEPPEPLPPGARRRPLLVKTGSRGTSPEFDLLTTTISHFPALMAAGECYLALPNPDPNFVTDLQTNNFASRLFELYLLACFREQGVIVRQEHVSPDFLIENEGSACWIEAVTANSETPRSGGIGDWVHAPVDRNERLTGAPAERFAKTLRGKLQRNYHELDHVKGMPFALAIADFHESGSMVWSREALPTYLYGLRADVEGEGAGRRAIGTPINKLTGKHGIPAGLFRDPDFAHLSAVIFSNAGTLTKFNRMGFLAGWRPPGLTMIRRGILYDRTPGALEPIDFNLSVDSDEYQALWPWGEAWCQELEVFHNPQATHPIPFNLIPGATHWFDRGSDVECSTIWANSVISSITHVRMTGKSDDAKRKRTVMTSAPATPHIPLPNTGETPAMATEPSDRTIVLHLLRGAVPERADEISSLWSQYGHGVEVAPSAKGVTMNADDKRIQFDTKTIDFFWLLGFSAWRAIEVYSPALVVATWTGMPLDQALKIDAERGQYEFDYKQRISTARSLIAAEQTAQISWPADIPQPTADRDSLGDVQHKTMFDLVALALAFALLHEFRHVMYCADESAPSTLPEEEIGCDNWAREYMTSGLAAYAKEHGLNYAQVQQKRAMGIALAAVIIHAMTPTHAHWGNRQYPPIAERLTAMISGYNLPAGSPFWPFTACLLIALMRQENRPLDIVAHSNQEMVEMLLDRLR